MKKFIVKEYYKNIVDCFLLVFQDRIKHTYTYNENEKEYTYIIIKASKKDFQLFNNFYYDLIVVLSHAARVDGF